ncbi:hypothetical protein FE257_008529 [Aspergillus nanangensis]|uniref:Uncharacterized protein n=1 Tax=Aspergillus nanangensis TaxID=2582783 RepID=A0AAD4GTD8_ASPNN|nr:hypothetical protein FE257_008529 [Aspergillus nanangensis]
MTTEYAFITGGASGVGKAIAEMLTSKNIKVFIADQNEAGARAVAQATKGSYAIVDVTSWESQLAAFSQAVAEFGRVDYVYPIAGISENVWFPEPPAPGVAAAATTFGKPNLQVLDINVTGAMYTVALAIQQFRRQTPNNYGFRGKIVIAGSVCGVYCCPSLPIYTASKHAITGLVRSWGKALPSEGITLNSINPNAMRTNISTGDFYQLLEAENLLTPLSGCVDACARLLGNNGESGECFEIGPNYDRGQGLVKPKFAPLEDEAQIRVFEKLAARGAAKRSKL